MVKSPVVATARAATHYSKSPPACSGRPAGSKRRALAAASVPAQSRRMSLPLDLQVQSGAPYRFIHGVRDPFEVVISGYQYHLRTTERWAKVPEARWNGTSYQRYLNQLPLHGSLF